MQYVGDENISEKLPHGNVKESENFRPFIRTIPSVLTRLTEQVINTKPSLVYKRAVAATNDARMLPRNSKQVNNVRQLVNDNKNCRVILLLISMKLRMIFQTSCGAFKLFQI